MATWLTHLRIAGRLVARLHVTPQDQFLIGSVAPDSGRPDESGINYSPPAEVTHCRRPFVDGEPPFCDLVFYRRYLSSLAHGGGDAACSAFRLGYFFHLLTDNLWYEQIAGPTLRHLGIEPPYDPQRIVAVRQDWHHLDLRYLRAHPDLPVWQAFRRTEVVESHVDVLPAAAVSRRVEEIKALYGSGGDGAGIPAVDTGLTARRLTRFVAETVDTLQAIHRLLWVERCETAGLRSALELLHSREGQAGGAWVRGSGDTPCGACST